MKSPRAPWPLLLLVALTFSAPLLHAQTALLGRNAYLAQTGNYGTLGASFNVNTGYTLTIFSVGYWDSASNGVTGGVPISVALFNNTTQQIIAGTQIDFSGLDGTRSDAAVDGGYRFSALAAPVVLTAGSYTIAEWNYGLGGGTDVFGNSNHGATFSPFGGAVSFNATTIASDFATNGIFPSTINSFSPDFSAGNFLATAQTVPEPTTAACLTLGFLALASSRPRRRR